MKRVGLQILKHLHQESATVTELAKKLDKDKSWISQLVSELHDQNLVERNTNIKLADNYEAQLLQELIEQYNLETLLTGQRDTILQKLAEQPRSATELQQETDLAKSTVYSYLKDLQSIGAVTKTGDTYQITDNQVTRFIEARSKPAGPGTRYEAGDETLTVTQPGQAEQLNGKPTAFSLFQRYGIDYHPVKTYLYHGDKDLDIEDVLIHALRTAQNKRQMTMCGIFYLTHAGILDSGTNWRLANHWDCVERWADLLAFLDQRETKESALFPTWKEFTQTANDYDVYPRGKHPETSLTSQLKTIGNELDESVTAYLIGGGNLILRGLKDTTKDIDVIVEDQDTFTQLVSSLRNQGYQERQNFEDAYQKMNPSIILEREGFPQFDIFVQVVVNKIRITDSMKKRCDKTQSFGNLKLRFISLTDIFLFKSVTEREGDLEDAALVAQQAAVNWKDLYEEVQKQEKKGEGYFSFDLLDTLDILEDRYDITTPITSDLVSYCLENALLLTLDQPKTIQDLREELDFPDHQIYNKLRKLEDNNLIKVDRTGKLNQYQTSPDH